MDPITGYNPKFNFLEPSKEQVFKKMSLESFSMDPAFKVPKRSNSPIFSSYSALKQDEIVICSSGV